MRRLRNSITFRDIHEGGKEAARHYKMNHREIDKAFKKHYDGAPSHLVREVVQEFYDRKDK